MQWRRVNGPAERITAVKFTVSASLLKYCQLVFVYHRKRIILQDVYAQTVVRYGNIRLGRYRRS